MEHQAFSFWKCAKAAFSILLLCTWIGLGAQETPYYILGPEGYSYGGYPGPVVSSSYGISGLQLIDDVCYFLQWHYYSMDMMSSQSYSVGYILPDSSHNLMTGTSQSESFFMTGMQDGVVFGFNYYGLFKWNHYNAQAGVIEYPHATFTDFTFDIDTRVYAVKMDDDQLLVIFCQGASFNHASCMDLDYNQIWGFSLAGMNLPGSLANGHVFALDSQRFLIASRYLNHMYLTIINSGGEIEYQNTIIDDSSLNLGPKIFKTKVQGVFLVALKEATETKLYKYENNSLSYLFTLPSIYESTLGAVADANSIIVMYRTANPDGHNLRKYSWEGDLIWAKALSWGPIYHENNIQLNEAGSIHLAMYSHAAERYMIAKILADGTDSYTENEDPTAAPTLQQISVSPNPFSREVKLSLKLGKADTIDLSIYNIRGQLIRKYENLQTQEGSIDCSWDAKNTAGRVVPNGVYLIRTQSKTGIYQAMCLKVD